jgi:hypothetical protein
VTDQLRHFLLVYDARSRSVSVEDLGEDADAAAQRYGEVEMEYEKRSGFEVVLIGADSLETIRQTHAHYFAVEDDDDKFFVLGSDRLTAAPG